MNPIDFYNIYEPFENIFIGSKTYYLKTPNEVVLYSNPNETVFTLQSNGLVLTHEAIMGADKGGSITKFILFTHLKFKGNWLAAMSFVQYDIMKLPVPYLRVKCDYFKFVTLYDRYDTPFKSIAGWKKEEIKQDNGTTIFANIPRFDGFVMNPDNKNFKQVYRGCFNLYSKFPHTSYPEVVNETDIPNSISLIKRVFGEQLEQGLIYLKVLYEYPKQILPILTLISEDRGTGKTTFINWIQMLFGENAVQISPESLTQDHNTIYAHKNIILIDEAFAEKKGTVEKIKHITTAEYITVNPKFVQQYSIPFYGKIILCTNKEKDFAQIDLKEIRFWVRKLSVITELNTRIEDDLKTEIPKFLKYLEQLPTPDFTKSRMVFTPAEIATKELDYIKEESKSWLRKAIEIKVGEFFDGNEMEYFEATISDIKERWFSHNSKAEADYISKVLREEMKMNPSPKAKKYSKFDSGGPGVSGRPYRFERVGPVEKVEEPDDESRIYSETDPTF